MIPTTSQPQASSTTATNISADHVLTSMPKAPVINSSETVRIQPSAGTEFLSALFGDLNRKENIEVRFIKDKQVIKPSEFFPSVQDLIRHWNEISAFATQANIYIGVCPRTGEKGTKENVNRLQALWVDVDAKKFAGGKNEAEQHIQSFPLPPSIIVDSGNGFHVYWLLATPEDISTEPDRDKLDLRLRRLAIALHGDLACAEVAHILRLPGTWNLKSVDQPLPVRLIFCDPSVRYSLTQVESHLSSESEGKNGTTAIAPKPGGWIADLIADMEVNGNRNTSMNRLMSSLRARGYSKEDAFALLRPHVEALKSNSPDDFDEEELWEEIQGNYRRYDLQGDGKLLSLADLMASNEPDVVWLVDKVFPDEGMGAIAGDSGVGKSWVLMDLALAVARGGLWLGKFPTKKGRVIYVDLDTNKRSLLRRFSKLTSGQQTKDGQENIRIYPSGQLQLDKGESVAAFRKQLDDFHPDLIIVDPFFASFSKGDENLASDLKPILQCLQSIARDYGCFVLYADHTPKPNFQNPGKATQRGSNVKKAMVDSLLMVSKCDGGLKVVHEKGKEGEEIKAFIVERRDGQDSKSTTVKFVGFASEKEHPKKKADAWSSLAPLIPSADADQGITTSELISAAKGIVSASKVRSELKRAKGVAVTCVEAQQKTGRPAKSWKHIAAIGQR